MTSSSGVPKQEFLESVRRSLGRAPGPPVSPYSRLEETSGGIEDQAAELHRRLEASRPALMDQLARVAALRDWNVFRAGDTEEALGYLSTLVSKLGITRCVRSAQDVFQQVAVDAPLQAQGVTVTAAFQQDEKTLEDGDSRESIRAQIAQAGLGITGADYAIAETGSVILVPRRGLSRLASVVPPVHLALVRPQDIVESLDDLFMLRRLEYYRSGGDMGSYLNFITGPSRTADIEQTIVVGVHGPGEVHMVLLE